MFHWSHEILHIYTHIPKKESRVGQENFCLPYTTTKHQNSYLHIRYPEKFYDDAKNLCLIIQTDASQNYLAKTPHYLSQDWNWFNEILPTQLLEWKFQKRELGVENVTPTYASMVCRLVGAKGNFSHRLKQKLHPMPRIWIRELIHKQGYQG